MSDSTKTRKITATIMAATVLLWIVWDIPMATNTTPGDTESEIITGLSYKLPLLPALLGALCGHWTIPNQSLFEKSWTGLYALLGIGALLGLWSALVCTGVMGGSFAAAHNWLAGHPYYVLPCFYPIGGALWGHGKSARRPPKPPTTHKILP